MTPGAPEVLLRTAPSDRSFGLSTLHFPSGPAPASAEGHELLPPSHRTLTEVLCYCDWRSHVIAAATCLRLWFACEADSLWAWNCLKHDVRTARSRGRLALGGCCTTCGRLVFRQPAGLSSVQL